MNRLRLGLAGLGLSALCACTELRAGANPDVPMYRHRPSFALSLSFSRKVVIPARVTGEPYERGQPEIDARGKRVFVGSSDRGLYALRAEDGSHIWRFETLGFVQCQPLYDPVENAVYFGSNDGALYRVDAKDGKLRWRFMTNAEVARRPVLHNGLLYVTNANDTVLALDPGSGKLVWQQHRTPAMGMEVAGHSGPLVFHDKVYAGFSDGNVMAFDARTGAERWQPVDLAAEAEQTLGELPQYLDVDTTPVPGTLRAGSVVFVGSYAGGAFALDSETGSQVWHNPGVIGVSDFYLWSERRAESDESAQRSILVASSGTTGIWGLDPETGTELWRRALPQGGASPTVPFAGALLVSATQLGVFLLSPLDGDLIDGIHVADGVSMTPATFGNRAFVVTNGGRLLSLQLPGAEPVAASKL
jgi:outer membrane protein assembly factor BamB